MFPQTGSSALFMNLSEDQQEFVTGGAFTESQTIDYTKTQYFKKSPEDPNGETRYLQELTGAPGVLNGLFLLNPLLSDLFRLNGGGDLL